MRPFTFRLTCSCLVGFALLACIFRAVGAGQSSHAALAGFRDGCLTADHPCWYGIVPKITSVEAAQTILARNGFHFRSAGGWRNQHFQTFEPDTPETNCHVRFEDSGGHVTALYLSDCSLRLGDLMLTSGIPDSLCMQQIGHFGVVYSQNDSMIVMIAHKGMFTPLSTIEYIRMNPNLGFLSTRWRGFRLPSVYEKRYAEHTVCYWE